jgi:hypothetical protein
MWKIVALALLVAACASERPTKAEGQASSITKALDSAHSQTAECVTGIERSPDYARLSDRFAFGPPSMSMLADKRKPVETDIPPLLAIHRQLEVCRGQFLQGVGRAHPGFVTGVAATYAEADIDFAKLVRRDISWGEYAELSLRRATRYDARWQEAVQKVGAGVKAAHASEIEERNAASRALSAWAQAQRASLPVYTSCVYTGPVLSCSSY